MSKNVKLHATDADRALINQIAKRAHVLIKKQGIKRDLLCIQMDLAATHLNGNPLRLADLLKADDFNLLHDVGGIWNHLNRETGELTNCFRPRFSAPEAATA